MKGFYLLAFTYLLPLGRVLAVPVPEANPGKLEARYDIIIHTDEKPVRVEYTRGPERHPSSRPSRGSEQHNNHIDEWYAGEEWKKTKKN
ncbi:hypothetical protein ABW20_dc0109968 [Dactylellina cionopaga]|nr:hypothetical protein ABW20_dc0109968 [Dactylellina cionopaga]